MTESKWVVVAEVPSDLVEILRGLLEAQGIDVTTTQEAVARAIGLTTTAQILVPRQSEQLARAILAQHDEGDLLVGDDAQD